MAIVVRTILPHPHPDSDKRITVVDRPLIGDERHEAGTWWVTLDNGNLIICTGDDDSEAIAEYQAAHWFGVRKDNPTSEVVGVTISSTGAALIAAERQRQVEDEGWSAQHDDEHIVGDLARAAVCYAMPEEYRGDWRRYDLWPWEHRYWKPSPGDRVRELVKAGALIAAEIDRLKRAEDA